MSDAPDANPTEAAPTRGGSRALLGGALRQREVPLLGFILLVGLYGAFASPYFLSGANLSAVLLGLSLDAIIVVAMAVLLISGGFDLSVGSTLALSGMVCGILMSIAGAPWPLAVLAALGTGALVGAINGLLVTRARINPLIATLGMLAVARSATLIISGDQAMSSFPPSFTWLGQGRVLGLVIPVWIVLALVIAGEFALRRTRAGRLAFYVGSNASAADLSGLRVKRIQFALYVLTGTFAALAGVIATARLNAAFPLAGNGAELRVIAAAVIGGASLAGGQGSIVGAFLGVVLLALINNLLILNGVPIAWQGMVAGAVLIAAVGFDEASKARRGAS